MKKIISLFQRNYDGDRLVRDEVVPGAEWVLAGEGEATRKYDGTCCLVRDGKLFARYDLPLTKEYRNRKRRGYTGPTWEHQPPPAEWEPAQDTYDPTTGHWPGWMPVGGGPEHRWHQEAWRNHRYLSVKFRVIPPPPDGTYELIGPKVQGNPEHVENHMLVEHGYLSAAERDEVESVPRDFEGIKRWLSEHDVEGIVWHHPDGRMAKVKAKDFGIRRGAQPR